MKRFSPRVFAAIALLAWDAAAARDEAPRSIVPRGALLEVQRASGFAGIVWCDVSWAEGAEYLNIRGQHERGRLPVQEGTIQIVTVYPNGAFTLWDDDGRAVTAEWKRLRSMGTRQCNYLVSRPSRAQARAHRRAKREG